MKCKLCNSENTKIIYNGLIREGGLGHYTQNKVEMHQCNECKVIWHEDLKADTQEYYESAEYRNELEGTTEEEKFYELHDKENLDKFLYTGTTIFRNKVVADIGCGCGTFLDFIKGVAQIVVAVEPSQIYREVMQRKGFDTYAYTSDAKLKHENNIDVITSFDVIEHVLDPLAFLKDIYDLLNNDGQAIIGTPTETPIMIDLLGEIYEKELLFSTQHIWIFSEENLKMLAEQVGFKNVKAKYFQRYGIGNMLGWVKEKRPKADIEAEYLTTTLDQVWRSECSRIGMADYIVLYLKK